MDSSYSYNILQEVAAGSLTPEDALEKLGSVEDIGFARIDHARSERCGFPEVIFAQNKTPEQCVAISEKILERSNCVLLSRVTPEIAEAICRKWSQANYNEMARTIFLGEAVACGSDDSVIVVSAGTSDMSVAEEAVETLKAAGVNIDTLYDCGVAGLHRLLEQLELLRAAKVVIVIAGMEGALPSVVGGLVSAPVIAVPTSIGYGASFQGVAALLGMLNSCASGLGVVNIDNGFGAACLAIRMINTFSQKG